MKKIFAVCFSLLAFTVCIAQKHRDRNKDKGKIGTLKDAHIKRYDTTCIILDPFGCSNNLLVPDFLREDSRLSIKIINVNPLAAKIAIDGKSDTVDYDIPDGFASLGKNAEPGKDSDKKVTSSPTFSAKNMNGIISIKTGKEKKPSDIAKEKAEDEKRTKIEAITKKLNDCLAEFNDSLRTLSRLLNLHGHVAHIFAIPIIKREDFIAKINAEIHCIGADTTCCWYRNRYDSLFKIINGQFTCIKNHYRQLTELTGTASAQTVTIDITVEDDHKNLRNGKIKDAKIETINVPADENKLTMDKVNVFMEKFNSDSSVKKMGTLIDSLTSICIELKTLPAFYVCQSPLTVTGDVYTILASIKNGNDTVFKFPAIPFRTYGGFRLNFSTGLGFSFLNNNQGFTKEKAGDDSFHIRRESVHSVCTPSIVAFMHAYWRSKHRINPGITAGISTNPTDLTSTRFFIGVSAIFGQNRRFILSAGLNGGQTEQLARNFEKDKIYANADFTGLEDKDLVEKKFKLGLFFGFSYNLSAKR